jgi:hypothetical protein
MDLLQRGKGRESVGRCPIGVGIEDGRKGYKKGEI